MSELAHLIEKCEREIFSRSAHLAPTPKEYRHNYPLERSSEVAEIQVAWNQVKALASPLNISIDDAATGLALTQLTTLTVDGYDLFLLQAAAQVGVAQVIIDDGDYATVAGIRIFTCNRAVVAAAQNQGRLVRR